MVRPMPIIHAATDHQSFSTIPLAIGLFVSVSLLVGLCAKHARQLPRKYGGSKTSDENKPYKSPLPSPKLLITTISPKTVMSNLVHGKKSGDIDKKEKEEEKDIGVWQKAILMGERCQPPEFSGGIYYDYCGNRIPEIPKSPRASPLRNFITFQVEKNDTAFDSKV